MLLITASWTVMSHTLTKTLMLKTMFQVNESVNGIDSAYWIDSRFKKLYEYIKVFIRRTTIEWEIVSD